MATPDWFADMLGWKAASKLATSRCRKLFGEARGPNLADLSGTGSTAIAGRVYQLLGIPITKVSDIDLDANDKKAQASTGAALERALEADLSEQLQALVDDRDWELTRTGSVSQFAQYTHLAELQWLFEERPTLRSTLGQDYQVSTDVMISLPDPNDAAGPRLLHAAVSSKLTIRSDRVQNIRYEFGMLVKNRKGRLPHLVVVTAEPLPSRLVSIARGTGEIDAVYHLLFHEMQEAISSDVLAHFEARHMQKQRLYWQELVDQKRIRPYSELVAILGAA